MAFDLMSRCSASSDREGDGLPVSTVVWPLT